MPVATIDPEANERFELKTAPPDGFVMLRPLPYGMKLNRRDKATRMKMRTQAPQPGSSRGRMAQAQESEIELETASEWATAFDFAYCIVDHNLTDSNNVKLDFTNVMSLKMLNPRIGSEIERLIFDLNEEEDSETMEDFFSQSGSSYVGEPTLPKDGGDDFLKTTVQKITDGSME